jgi:hypothetical protein
MPKKEAVIFESHGTSKRQKGGFAKTGLLSYFHRS